MTSEKWQKLSFAEQMGNIGSEFSRARHWQESGDFTNRERALERMIELIDLTISDKRWRSRLFEILRLREVICDLLIKKGDYNISPKSLQEYFLFFGLKLPKTYEKT